MARKEAHFPRLLDELRRRCGVIEDLDETRPLEQIILLLLAKGAPLRKARSAVRRLQEDYVDWNEVRVSSVCEVMRALEPLGPGHTREKSEQVLRLLGEVYGRFNKLQMDTLMNGPLDGDRSRRLERFEQFLLGTLCPLEEAKDVELGEAVDAGETGKPAADGAPAPKAAKPPKKAAKPRAPKAPAKPPPSEEIADADEDFDVLDGAGDALDLEGDEDDLEDAEGEFGDEPVGKVGRPKIGARGKRPGSKTLESGSVPPADLQLGPVGRDHGAKSRAGAGTAAAAKKPKAAAPKSGATVETSAPTPRQKRTDASARKPKVRPAPSRRSEDAPAVGAKKKAGAKKSVRGS